jgi:hypothetical protein
MRILFTLLLALLIGSAVEAQVPPATTTKQKAVSDMVDGIRNEEWFEASPTQRSCIFRCTAVGLKHAVDKYKEMRNLFDANECENEDIISSLARKTDGEIDYEMLAISLKQESSELNRNCRSNSTKVKGVLLHTTASGMVLLTLMLR